MKQGCVVMTLSSSRRSGSRQIYRGRKKRVKFAAVSSPCWSFFDIQCIVHKEFVPPGQTVNGKFYCEILKLLREGIRRKRPDMWKKNNWFLHHDNAPAHTSLVFRQFLTSKNITVIPHPSVRLTSPPATLCYSPKWNYGWKGVVLTRLRRSTQKRKRYRHTHIWELPGMHEIMGNTLGSLLRRRRWKLGVTVRNIFCGQIPRIFG